MITSFLFIIIILAVGLPIMIIFFPRRMGGIVPLTITVMVGVMFGFNMLTDVDGTNNQTFIEWLAGEQSVEPEKDISPAFYDPEPGQCINKTVYGRTRELCNEEP